MRGRMLTKEETDYATKHKSELLAATRRVVDDTQTVFKDCVLVSDAEQAADLRARFLEGADILQK